MKTILYFMFQKFLIFRMQCISVWNTSLFISCTYSYKDKVLFQKVHAKSVTRTELQIAPDWSYHPWKTPRSSWNLAGSALIKAWTLSLNGVQLSVECPLTPPWYSHLALKSYHSGYGGFLVLAGIIGILYFWTNFGSSWA